MAQPGQPSARGDDWLVRKVQELEQRLQQLAAANVFGTTGITPQDGGTQFDGYVKVNGPMTVNGEQTVDGDSVYNGALSILGPLTLKPGSIQNDSLANPIQMATSSNGVNNYAITTTSTVRASITITVPNGFTQAVVIANPTAMGYNNTSTADYLYVQAVVQGVNSGELYSAAGAGLGVGVAAPFHTTLTGLTGGGSITVSVATRTSTATWAASTSNQANIYATALFLR